MNTESPNSVNPSVWNTPEKPFDYYSTNFDVYDADVMCDGCKSVFEWTDKEADSGDDIPICSVVCYNSYYDVEEEEERYCDNEVCPYGGYIYDEELEKYKGKEYVCVGCETGKGLQEREQEEDKDQHWGSAMSILLYGKEEEVCSDCDRGFGQLDANDVELTGEGKYARCADCEDERFSHMEDACDECGDRVGRHAANVGTLGMAICFDCDSHGAMIENE